MNPRLQKLLLKWLNRKLRKLENGPYAPNEKYLLKLRAWRMSLYAINSTLGSNGRQWNDGAQHLVFAKTDKYKESFEKTLYHPTHVYHDRSSLGGIWLKPLDNGKVVEISDYTYQKWRDDNNWPYRPWTLNPEENKRYDKIDAEHSANLKRETKMLYKMKKIVKKFT